MNRNLLASLFENNRSIGSKSALLDFDTGRDLSWSEIWSLSLSISQRIREVSPRQRYFVCVTKDPTLSCLFLLGAWQSGATPVLVNPSFTSSEFSNVKTALSNANADDHVWLCDETTFEKIEKTFSDPVTTVLKLDSASLKIAQALNNSIASNSFSPPPMADRDALGLFTSGTTHLPKLVLFSHRNLFRAAEIEIENDSLLKSSCVANLRPHFTSGGCNTLWPWIQSGGRMIFSSATAQLPIARNFRNLSLQARPDLLVCSPSMLNVLVETDDGNTVSDAPITTYFGGMSVSESVLNALNKMGLRPWMRYGMTEIGHVVSRVDLSQGPPYPQKGDVGPAYRGISVSSKSDTLVFRGDGIARSCVDDDFNFVSDDLGEVRGGRIELRGRENRIANVNGFRFPVAEVQAALESRNELEHVLVLAIPNGFKGDEVVVFFKPRDPNAAHESALRLYLQNILVNFKRPNRYIPVQDWPLAANGKVNQAALMDLLK